MTEGAEAVSADLEPDHGPVGALWSKIAALLVVAGAIVVLVWGPRDLAATLLELWQAETGVIGGLSYAAFYLVATACFVPSALLGIGAGFLFGGVWGTVIVLVCRPLGALLAFLIGRHLARGYVERWIEGWPRFEAIDRLTADEPFQVVILLRLVPVLTFNVTNYVFGLTSAGWKQFWGATFLGVLPGSLFYVYLGVVTGDVTRAVAMEEAPAVVDGVGVWIAGAVAFAGIIAYIAYRARQKWKELLAQQEQIGAES